MTARLEVIVGPMFSGKTERLIARLHRAQYARSEARPRVARTKWSSGPFRAANAASLGERPRQSRAKGLV